MPIGEVIGEVLKPILECVIYGASYFTGYCFLNIVTCGNVKIAPFLTGYDRKKKKRKWDNLDWGIYDYVGIKGKQLRSDLVCVVGFFVWAALGYGIYLSVEHDATEKKQAHQQETLVKVQFIGATSGENEYFNIRIEGEVNDPL
ncbi:MAG: hypothetical protein ACI9E1_001052 [Cryomorphaceae bacterium]|jgi:hypothetical protein